jgi:hypothetical protein
MLPLSSCVVINATRILAYVPVDAVPCASCALAVTFPGYADVLLFGTANITIVAAPRITAVIPVNLPIGSTGLVSPPVVGGINFPTQKLPCRCEYLSLMQLY